MRPTRLQDHVVGFACTGALAATLLSGACSSPGGGGAGTPTAPASAPASAGTSAPSSAQARLAACAQLQSAGNAMSDTVQKYVDGRASGEQVAAATASLLTAVQGADAVADGALRAQLDQIKSSIQALLTTLRASPKPSKEQIVAAAQPVLDALKGLDRPCASPA